LQLADEEGTRSQLKQQRKARHQLAGMPELVLQLQYPSTPARIRQRWPHAGVGLDGKAPEIIRKLLDSRPMFALQGPPGTGKTTVIANAVQQCLDRDRNTRILIAAQSHYALDNLAERIHAKLKESGMGDVDALRIVSPKSKDRDFPAVVRGYFIEKLVENRRRFILRHCDELLEYGSPLDRVDPKAAGNAEPGPYRRGHRLSKRDLIHRWHRVIEKGEMELYDRLRRGANLVFCTTGTATETYLGVDREDSFDWVIVDEAAKAWPTELIMPLVHGQRWALIGDHSQLGAFGKLEVRQVLDKCLNSELEELRRAGERKNDYLKVYELFKNLIEGDPNDIRTGRSGYLEHPVEVLSEQFRMHPAISDVISKRFYEGILQSGKGTSERRHGIEGCDWLGERALVWVDTGNSRDAPESGEPRWHNPKEVEIILEILDQLGNAVRRTVVLSPYNAQLDRLRDQVRDDFRERLYTVDAFQGREADIVIVSLVRCNEAKRNELIKRLGFLVEAERVNVLFSRARALLIVVGSFDQFYKSESEFWPKLCDQIQAGGESARIDYREILAAGDAPVGPSGGGT